MGGLSVWSLGGAQGLFRESRPAGPLKAIVSGSEEDASLFLLASAGTFPEVICRAQMATHSSVLAWRIPGMAEPGGLLSMGSHRVRND